MDAVEIVILIVTIVCLLSLCIAFTILFRHYYLTNIQAISSGAEDDAVIENAIDEEKAKQKKTRKAFGVIGKILAYTFLGFVIVIFAFSLVGKAKGDVIPFGDTSVLVIGSGSMSERKNNYVIQHPELTDQLDVYDIIGISEYQDQEEVELFDIVAYINKEGIVIVHRIVEIQTNEKGEEVYLTQGDSNVYADNVNSTMYSGYLPYDKIIGKYNGFRMPGVGVFVKFLQSPAGIVTIASVIYCLLMVDRYSAKYRVAIEKRTNYLMEHIGLTLHESENLDVETTYNEILIYKGNKYFFNSGTYCGKETNNFIEKVIDEYVVRIHLVENKNTVIITNTVTKETETIEDVSDVDVKHPEKFILINHLDN